MTQRRKYANACRMNVGRTGPKGEVGITEDLRCSLYKDPDPQEVQREMRKDKGYSGLSKKQKETLRTWSPTKDEDFEHYEAKEQYARGMHSTPMSSVTKQLKEDETLSKHPRVDPTYVKELELKLKALEEQTHVAQSKQTVLSCEEARPSF